MDFKEALRFLQTATNESVSRRHPGRLDRMRALLSLIGDPQRSFRSIHIGGTSGKGSTATMCAAILSAAGHKIGLHTKPHLRSVTERAVIGGAPVSEARFASLIEELLPAVDSMRTGPFGPPSYFELLVALAFLLFARERVDAAVVEVGIGGTLDGTNVLDPMVSIITNVGTDHTEVLGGTVEAIARDKSGIVKPGVPVVTAAEHPGALAEIRAAAQREGAPLHLVAEAAHVEASDEPPYQQRARVVTSASAYEFVLPLMGRFQVTNAATAIVALERIADVLPVSPAHVAAGLAGISLPGRMEYYPSRPPVVLDVAHNAEKAAALAEGLHHHFPGRRFTFVMAVAEGKAAREMLGALAPLAGRFIFTTFDVAHLTPVRPQRLALTAEQLGLSSRAIEDPLEALAVARRTAGPDDVLVVTGSTYVVARLRERFADELAGGPQRAPA